MKKPRFCCKNGAFFFFGRLLTHLVDNPAKQADDYQIMDVLSTQESVWVFDVKHGLCNFMLASQLKEQYFKKSTK